MKRCHICYSQRRPRDLLDEEFLKVCVFCGREFCYPHHSANPVEFSGVTRSCYVYKWVDFDGTIKEDRVPATFLCLICGLSKQPKNFTSSQHLLVQEMSGNFRTLSKSGS